MTLIGTLGGAWLGVQLSRDKEERQWRRDRSLDAYTDLLRASEIVREAASKLYSARFDDNSLGSQLRILQERCSELQRVADRASLLAPDEMQEPIRSLVDHYSDLVVSFTTGKVREIELRSYAEIISTEVEVDNSFRAKVRTDLHLNRTASIFSRLRGYWEKAKRAATAALSGRD